MADGVVEIDIRLETDKAKSQAEQTGKQVGEKFEDGVLDGADGLKKTLPDETGEAAKKSKTPVKKPAKDAGEEFAEQMTKAAKSGLGSFGATVAGVIGIGAVIDGAFASVDVANEFSEDMGKLQVAFEQAGHSAETANEVYNDFVGILGETDQSVEAANHLAKLTKSEEELSKWTNIAAGVYATFGDSLPLEGLTEAANETAKVGQVVGPLADALNWAGVQEDEFNAKLAELITEEERAAYITETLSGLYDSAGQAYLDTNEAVVEYRQSQSDLNESMAEIGETLMPLVSAFSEWGASMLDNVQPMVESFVENLPGIVKTFKDWLPLIVGAAAGVAAFVVAINFSAIVTAVTAALNGAKAAVAGLNTVMSANPIGVVIALLSALIGVFMALWSTNEGFRNAVIEAWESLKASAAETWGAIVAFFTETVPAAIQALIDWFSSIPERVSEFLTNAIGSVSSFATDMRDKAIQAGRDFFGGLVDEVGKIPDRMLEIGGEIVRGIWNGITGAAGWLWDQITGFANGIVEKAQEALGIHSPSKVMAQRVGRPMAEGVGVGFEKYSPVKDIQSSLTAGLSSFTLAASAAGGPTTNYFTIERIDAHDMAGVNNVQQLISLFERNR